ncbi:hypothetical protein BH20ACT5_BH20ACT5_24380 [soil metagenome]
MSEAPYDVPESEDTEAEPGSRAGLEVNEADAFEQDLEVPLDDDDRR